MTKFFDKYPLVEVNLSEHAELIKSDDQWLDKLEQKYGGNIYGGWLEDRSAVFDNRHNPKAAIHLGVDYWLPSGTPVYFPYKGKIIYQHCTSAIPGGWGNRLDILTDRGVYIIGHLAGDMRFTLGPGDDELLGFIGSREVNGGWKPHCHIQRMDVNYYYQLAHKDGEDQIDAYAPNSSTLDAEYPNPEV